MKLTIGKSNMSKYVNKTTDILISGFISSYLFFIERGACHICYFQNDCKKTRLKCRIDFPPIVKRFEALEGEDETL